MSLTDSVIELVDYQCYDCGENKWILRVGYRSDDKTYLIITCANEECVEAKRKELEIEDDEMIIWDEFDITGQTEYHRIQNLDHELN